MSLNGLEKITDKILAEAQGEAETILANARAECARIEADYAAKSDAIREGLAVDAEREGTDMIARAKAASATRRKNILLETRSRLLDDVFSSALLSLKSRSHEQYTELLTGLLTAALYEQVEAEKISRTLYGEEDAMAPASYELILNARDRDRCGKAVIEGVRKKAGAKLSGAVLDKLVLSDKTAGIDGGLILRCGDIESNCSFELLFSQLRRELESEVNRALFPQEAP